MVLDAAFSQGGRDGAPVLVESTANQVNQDGGYTGTTPAQFHSALMERAREAGFPVESLLVGGDHLGPFPWRSLPAAQAMDKARALVRDCVAAGYLKVHLDASMALGGDDGGGSGALPARLVAQREAALAAVAEEAFRSLSALPAPVYVLGTEVPVPGGTAEDTGVSVTSPAALQETWDECARAFRALGLEDAWSRVRALVAQPGVEFGDQAVHAYDRAAASALCMRARTLPRIVLEGHSTDYQQEHQLRQLVEDGVAVLKVGPALTFALRECLFSLERIEEELVDDPGDRSRLAATVDAAMLADPVHWQGYYHGSPRHQRRSRLYSLSDRIRYYWSVPSVREATTSLLRRTSLHDVPRSLLSQFLPHLLPSVLEGSVRPRGEDLARESVRLVLASYSRATHSATLRAPRRAP